MLKTLILGASIMTAATAYAAAPDDAILYRQDVMQTIGANAHAMNLIAEGQIPYSAAFATHANLVASAATLAVDAFRQNTHGQGKERTTAKAEVWKDWAKFEEGLKLLEERAKTVATLAASGGAAAAKDALGDLFKTCKGCHDDYRTK